MPRLTTIVRATTACAVSLLIPAKRADAQAVPVPMGARVRIEAASPNRYVEGTVDFQLVDTIPVTTFAGTRLIPIAAVKHMDVSEGRSHSDGLMHGAKIGAIGVAGAVTVLLVGARLATPDRECRDLCIDPLRAIPVLAPIGALTGAFVGGIIGGLVGSEQWTGVYLPQPRVSLAPHLDGRTSVGLSLRF